MKTKKQYKFGECIPESIKVYNRLKRKGYNPKMVEGWVEVNEPNIDLLPDESFLSKYYPKIYLILQNNYYYNDYPRVLQHTWIEVNKHKIDITKNQFDYIGGIKKYYKNFTYWWKSEKNIIGMEDIELGELRSCYKRCYKRSKIK